MSIVFYEQGSDLVRSELFDKDAKQWAERLVKPIGERKVKGVSRHQFRRLFEEVKRLQKMLINEKRKWAYVKPFVKMLKPKTAYTVARAKDKEKNAGVYYDALKDLFNEGIDGVNTERDFRAFCDFLEAVYGYYYELGGVNTK
ncbi:MAG: type III-A CRISPR-associated protein Csm2 [Spirochaetes bacterium]|nr:MAG: type III-A CRISPR-associated protein Csm2 [Spirochaetota bacterium]